MPPFWLSSGLSNAASQYVPSLWSQSPGHPSSCLSLLGRTENLIPTWACSKVFLAWVHVLLQMRTALHMSKRSHSQLRQCDLRSSGVIVSRKELSSAGQSKSWEGQWVWGENECVREEPGNGEKREWGWSSLSSTWFGPLCLLWSGLEKQVTWDQCFPGSSRRSKKPFQKNPNPEWRMTALTASLRKGQGSAATGLSESPARVPLIERKWTLCVQRWSSFLTPTGHPELPTPSSHQIIQVCGTERWETEGKETVTHGQDVMLHLSEGCGDSTMSCKVVSFFLWCRQNRQSVLLSKAQGSDSSGDLPCLPSQ